MGDRCGCRVVQVTFVRLTVNSSSVQFSGMKVIVMVALVMIVA